MAADVSDGGGLTGYDGFNRLIRAREDALGTWCAASAGHSCSWEENYGFDKAGNRWMGTRTGLADLKLETPVASSWFAGGTNQIVGWGYDASGNVLQVGGMPRAFDYDGEGRQVRATINGVETTYVYDAEGRRVRKTAACGTGTCATVYVLDAAGHVAAEYAMDGGSGTGRRYMTGDHLGSVRAVTDAAGLVKQSYDYLPFGGDLSAGDGGRTTGMGFSDFVVGTVGVRQPLEFTGKERDSETGLDYFGARYFSGAQGRFTSADPKLFPNELNDPQSWNKYGYGRNNPLRFIDPDGEDWKDVWAGAINAFGSDNLLGAGRTNGGNTDFRRGQAIGDAAATITGTVETLFGGGEAVLTSPAALTIAGTVVPAAGVVTAAHGSAVAVLAAKRLANAALASIENDAQNNSDKPSLSDHKKALGKVHDEVGKLPKGEPGKFGSPQAGDSQKGYRLDPPHPNAVPGTAETQTHINWWDFTKGKKNTGGRKGAEPVGPETPEQH